MCACKCALRLMRAMQLIVFGYMRLCFDNASSISHCVCVRVTLTFLKDDCESFHDTNWPGPSTLLFCLSLFLLPLCLCVCVSVSMCLCVYVCVRIYVCTCVRMYVYKPVCIYAHTRTQAPYTHKYTFTYACVYTCVCVTDFVYPSHRVHF